MTTRREVNLAIAGGALLVLAPSLARAERAETIDLPPPRKEGGRPLLQALSERRSGREYSAQPLSDQLLSDLLWAAFGINRPQSGDRTAPSWRHSIELIIYAATAHGVWRYDPKPHALVPHLRADLRRQSGTQEFVAAAPLNLIYAADGARMGNASPEEQRLYAYTDSGFIGQNVYLFCASEGLATVFRGSLDRTRLQQALQLPPTQFVTFAQTVGYPKE
jgi:nitroreductase